MLTVLGYDSNFRATQLGCPESVWLSKQENIPADSLELSFSESLKQELSFVELYSDSNLIFSGSVDEQNYILGSTNKTEIVARSEAALLTDSEAKPVSLNFPCTQDVFEMFAKPCGIESYTGENLKLYSRLSVPKGVSCFSVIKTFCNKVYGSFPRVEKGVLSFEGIINKNKVVFSQSAGKMPFEELEICNLRCNRIAKIYLKLKTSGGYDYCVENSDAVNKGVGSVRYLNASRDSGNTLCDADSIIKQGEKDSFFAIIKCTGCHADLLGAQAKLDVDFQKLEDLYVSEVKYVLNNNSNFTRLMLKRKERDV